MTGYLELLRRPKPSHDRGFGPDRGGVTVLVPTYSPPGQDRVETLRMCVAAVLAEAPDAVAFVVADNGLSAVDSRRVAELLRTTGCGYQVLKVPRNARTGRYTAAAARNAALEFLLRQPRHSPLRLGRLLFLDDDTALAEGALAQLLAVLDLRERAIAVCPKVIPVASLHDRPARPNLTRPAGAVLLPGALGEQGYDLLSVTSHGSLVTGRTVGLMVRTEPVLEWIRDQQNLFYEGTPFGSSEDMLAMAMLCHLGELWSAPGAEVFDEARRTPGATRSQQFAWGYDHAFLAGALAPPRPGVRALTWRGDTRGWEQGQADWGDCSGFLINPGELRLAYQMISAITQRPSVNQALFGEFAPKVSAGTPLLGRILQRWEDSRAATVPRPDLPPLSERDWASLREGLDAFVGHLAGNIAGSLDARPHFLYGARQPAAPSPSIDWSLPWPTGSVSLEPVS